ncbi:hypothetical protein ABXV18_24865 [Vibrio owensii]
MIKYIVDGKEVARVHMNSYRVPLGILITGGKPVSVRVEEKKKDKGA